MGLLVAAGVDAVGFTSSFCGAPPAPQVSTVRPHVALRSSRSSLGQSSWKSGVWHTSASSSERQTPATHGSAAGSSTLVFIRYPVGMCDSSQFHSEILAPDLHSKVVV